MAVVCAVLAESFSSLSRSYIRLLFETVGLTGCGLFGVESVRNRKISLESQEKLGALVETSPAAVVTVDEHGFIQPVIMLPATCWRPVTAGWSGVR